MASAFHLPRRGRPAQAAGPKNDKLANTEEGLRLLAPNALLLSPKTIGLLRVLAGG